MLADTYSLYLKTHAFHWNVEGPMFNTLHLMFMDAVHGAVERARCHRRAHPLARYPAPGTNTEFAQLTSIEESPGVPEAMEMVAAAGRRARSGRAHRAQVFPAAEKAGDESTADLLTQRLQVHEKTAWMLRSLLR